ncbi:hypothetical protein [Ktedonosporobacter rubrisoli]|uniref:hypothetical protein n=1 Tax=Ktedonosporobacter rubrisoli TaxID=2509675 RepID=UPI0013EEB911|nr:hypothetical protein [Ktedonosporobacter rubrisoli]
MSEDIKDVSQLLRYEPPVPGRSFSWQPLRAEAQAAALCVAERMREPSSVHAMGKRPASNRRSRVAGLPWPSVELPCSIAIWRGVSRMQCVAQEVKKV